MKVPTKKPARVLAIDPGYDRLGISVVEGDASRPILVWSDCIIPPKGSGSERLHYIFKSVSKAIARYKPVALAIETLFFGINKKTAIQVAEARGAVLSAAGSVSLSIIECSPQQVKISVTGNGQSDKKTMAVMVPRLIELPRKKRLDDELDAIAIGITGLAMIRQAC